MWDRICSHVKNYVLPQTPSSEPMSLVTAVSVDTELVVYSNEVEGQFSETGLLSLWPCI